MKTKHIIDITIILILAGAGGYFVYTYLLDNTSEETIVQLQESAPAIPDQKVIALIRHTGASDSEDMWYPQILSNRWKHIRIFQSDLLTGNSNTLAENKTAKGNTTEPAYHFIITNGYGGADGHVEVSPSWKTQKDSRLTNTITTEKNSDNRSNDVITICLIGDFNAQAPTAKQIASLKGLLNFLLEETPVKSYNITFNSSSTLKKLPLPEYFPLNDLVKSRLSTD